MCNSCVIMAVQDQGVSVQEVKKMEGVPTKDWVDPP